MLITQNAIYGLTHFLHSVFMFRVTRIQDSIGLLKLCAVVFNMFRVTRIQDSIGLLKLCVVLLSMFRVTRIQVSIDFIDFIDFLSILSIFNHFHLFHLFWLFSIFGLILPKLNNFNKFCYHMTRRRNKGSILDGFVFKTNLLLVILILRACAKGNLWLGTCPNVFNKTERGP